MHILTDAIAPANFTFIYTCECDLKKRKNFEEEEEN